MQNLYPAANTWSRTVPSKEKLKFLTKIKIAKMNLFDLTGEVAVVLGATGVLGGAMAESLAAAGAKVAILGRNEERGEARVRSIQKLGGTAGFFPADALDQSSLQGAREALLSRLGAPTVLVNAAGGNHPRVTVTPEHP